MDATSWMFKQLDVLVVRCWMLDVWCKDFKYGLLELFIMGSIVYLEHICQKKNW